MESPDIAPRAARQPAGLGRRTRQPTVPGREHIGDPLGRTTPGSNFEQRSDERPHHVAQERRPRDLDSDQPRRRLRDVDSPEDPHRPVRLAANGLQGREVLLSDEPGRRASHGVDVEALAHVVRPVRDERVAAQLVPDVVAVALSARAVARVKRRIDRLHADHSDVVGEQAVERLEQRGRVVPIGVERRHLPNRVHTGVRSARAPDLGRPPVQPRRGRGQRPLDGARRGLDLPPVEVGAVVGDEQSRPHCALRTRTRGRTSATCR